MYICIIYLVEILKYIYYFLKRVIMVNNLKLVVILKLSKLWERNILLNIIVVYNVMNILCRNVYFVYCF